MRREELEILVEDIILLLVFGGVLLSPVIALLYLVVQRLFS